MILMKLMEHREHDYLLTVWVHPDGVVRMTADEFEFVLQEIYRLGVRDEQYEIQYTSEGEV